MSKFFKNSNPEEGNEFFISATNGRPDGISAPLLLDEPVIYPDTVIVAISVHGLTRRGALWSQQDLDAVDYQPSKSIKTPDWMLADATRKFYE